MKNIFKRSHIFFLKISERLSSILYVPSQTGSHNAGEQYMGDVASTYIEHKNFQSLHARLLEGLYCLNAISSANTKVH